jgi:hypothetical protein
MRRAIARAELYLNDVDVGSVAVDAWEGSWGFGQFLPNENFARFSLVFGRWSLLMHAEDDCRQLSPEALDELRKAEYAIDALRARLHFVHTGEWRRVRQVNIDGNLIEWKE